MAATRRVTITAGSVQRSATLNASTTADAIWQALPLEGRANRWGDEIYFSTAVSLALEPAHASEVVPAGALGYWPPGNAFCLFWGRTPASRGDEIRAASAVTVFGQVDDDPQAFGAVRSGAQVRIEQAEE